LHLKKMAPCLVVVLVRISCKTQDARPQKEEIKRILNMHGSKMVGCITEVRPGWSKKRPKLMKAIKRAKRLGATLVVITTNRIVRPSKRRYYENRMCLPLKKDFERIMQWAEGVPIATAYDPDSSPEKEKRLETKRGIKYASKKLPRGSTCKERKAFHFEQVIKLRAEEGYSFKKIALLTEIPCTTCYRWWAAFHFEKIR